MKKLKQECIFFEIVQSSITNQNILGYITSDRIFPTKGHSLIIKKNQLKTGLDLTIRSSFSRTV